MSTVPGKLEIGKEVKTFCGKCKTEMIHVITKITGGEIDKVFCKGCNTTHTYRGSQKSKPAATRSSSPQRRRRKPDWATLVAEIDDHQIVDYDITADFSNAVAIRHKKFGVGVITNVVDRTKIEVVFQGATKVLAHNWE